MRQFLTICCFLTVLGVSAQVSDNPNTVKKIPAKETEKQLDTESKDNTFTTIEPEKTPLPLRVKTIVDSIDLTESKSKGFSMIQDNDLVDPGVIYEERFRKKSPVAETGLQYETDMYFGEHSIKSKYIKIAYRDFEAQDGDIIRIFVNDDVIVPRVFLTKSYQGYKLELKDGFNKIDFVALNQGDSGPNTAQFLIINDKEEVIYNNSWNLATGGKASIVFVKE